MRFATRMMCVASEPTVNEIYDPAVSITVSVSVLGFTPCVPPSGFSHTKLF